MVGFSNKYPQQPHHRAASLPSRAAKPQKIGCNEGYNYFNLPNPNPNVATGAIVGGPDQNDNYNDARGNYQQTEPTTYINAPIIGVLAVLASGNSISQFPTAIQQFQDPMDDFLATDFSEL